MHNPISWITCQSNFTRKGKEDLKPKKYFVKLKHDMSLPFSEKNEASCFKFMRMPMTQLRPNHIGMVSKGVKKSQEIVSQMEKEENNIPSNLGILFNRSKLKPWASEHYQCAKAVQEELAQMKGDVSDKLEKMLSIKQSLDRKKFKSLPNKTGMKNGRQKKRKRKAEKRKRQLLNKIQEETRRKIIKRVSEEAYKSITKQMLPLNESRKIESRQAQNWISKSRQQGKLASRSKEVCTCKAHRLRIRGKLPA